MSRNFIIYESRNRITGTLCQTLNTVHPDSNLPNKGGRYAARCVDHDSLIRFDTLYPAGRAIAHPDEWCSKCQALVGSGALSEHQPQRRIQRQPRQDSTGAKPVRQEQLGAAARLYSRMPVWMAIDTGLDALKRKMPGFSFTECLVKAAVINQFYGTNILAMVDVARHVAKVMENGELDTLVERLAHYQATGGRPRRHFSFASKFAHFFVDEARFAVFDSYAVETLRYHLRHPALASPDTARKYAAFIEMLPELIGISGIQCTNRELDRYLWLAGVYRAYLRGRTDINAEVLRLFRAAEADEAIAQDLGMIVAD